MPDRDNRQDNQKNRRQPKGGNALGRLIGSVLNLRKNEGKGHGGKSGNAAKKGDKR